MQIQNRVLPDVVQLDKGLQPIKNDPLGILDAQGVAIVKDTKTDPIGALNSPFGGFAKSPNAIKQDRMTAKMRDVFALASTHDGQKVELARSAKLAKL